MAGELVHRFSPIWQVSLCIAYEEARVKPVVSDFDLLLVGTRGVTYSEPLPQEQVAPSKKARVACRSSRAGCMVCMGVTDTSVRVAAAVVAAG